MKLQILDYSPKTFVSDKAFKLTGSDREEFIITESFNKNFYNKLIRLFYCICEDLSEIKIDQLYSSPNITIGHEMSRVKNNRIISIHLNNLSEAVDKVSCTIYFSNTSEILISESHRDGNNAISIVKKSFKKIEELIDNL